VHWSTTPLLLLLLLLLLLVIRTEPGVIQMERLGFHY
jgi:hypothetical protein